MGGPKFEIKHKSCCFQKSKLFDWGAKHVDWGARPPLALGAGFVKILVFVQDGLWGATAPLGAAPSWLRLWHQHRSRKFSIHRSTRQFQNLGALLMKFPQYQSDTGGLRKQVPTRFLSVTKRSSSRWLGPGKLVQLEYIFCALPPFASQALSYCVDGFTVTVSLWGKL